MGNLIDENESDNQTETADENATALDEDAPVDLIEESRPPMENRQKGGRPAGTTTKGKGLYPLPRLQQRMRLAEYLKTKSKHCRRANE